MTMILNNEPDVRAVVRRRLREIGWTHYTLARACRERGARNVTGIYEWLAGRRDIGLSTFSPIMAALGLKVIPGGPVQYVRPLRRGRKPRQTATR